MERPTHTFSSGITVEVQRVGWPAMSAWAANWERANPAPVPPAQEADGIAFANTLHPQYVADKLRHDAAREAMLNEHAIYMALRPQVDPVALKTRVAEIRAMNAEAPTPQELSASDVVVFLQYDAILTPQDWAEAVALIEGRKVTRGAIEAAKDAMFPGDVQGPVDLAPAGVAE